MAPVPASHQRGRGLTNRAPSALGLPNKKPLPSQGPWIVLPGDGSASLRDRPVFPEWVLYDFQPLGIRHPDGFKRSNQLNLIEVDVALGKEVFDRDRAAVVINNGIITLLQRSGEESRAHN